MQFAALLSINLAIMNALPIPALDGGRLLFVILEAVRRKKVTATFEASLHRVGFLLLLALVALVTINDLRHFGGAIVSGIRRAAGF
jgi:regulator of sigma E protease